MSLRVAVTRPIADARRSAEALRALGFEPVLVPVMTVRATGAAPPDENFDALLATSANAFAMLGEDVAGRLSGLPLYVAGGRTAAAARAAGFGEAEAVAAEAVELAAVLAARLPRASRLLYLTGRDRKSDLEATLGGAGHRVVASEVYAAEPRGAWSAAEARAFASCAAATHYSRRSAELAAVLADRAGLGGHFRAILHACLSQDAAAPLRALGATRIVVASGPRESCLLDALGSAAGAANGGS